MTRRLLLPALVAVLALPPASAYSDRMVPAGRPVPGFPGGGGFGGAGAPGPGGFPGNKLSPQLGAAAGTIAPPHPWQAAVIELLEDDSGRLARALNAGGQIEQQSRGGAWAGDCYSGATALKVAGLQRYRDNLAGWAYPIVGNPRPGEYRYLRFAWKRPEGTGAMIQLCAGGVDWGRYFAGANNVGFYPALQIDPQPPREWTVVTRDLFADFGQVPFTLTGMSFTPMDGFVLYDHVYLGRSVEDLDKVTNTAAQWARRSQPLDRAQLDHFWKDVGSDDAAVRQPAVSVLAACGGTSVPYIAQRVTIPDPAVGEKRMTKAVVDLDSPRYAVREKASRELEAFGPTALPRLEEALKRPDLTPEWRTRLEKLVADIKAENQLLTTDQRRTLRVIHILEAAETAAAKELLTKLSKANLEAGLSDEARAAMERLAKRGK